jgi:hypothetical protein
VIAVVIIVVALAILLIVSLRLRRHGESVAPDPSWQRTNEVFRDPSSDRVMRVWIDGQDGSRHYVPDG